MLHSRTRPSLVRVGEGVTVGRGSTDPSRRSTRTMGRSRAQRWVRTIRASIDLIDGLDGKVRTCESELRLLGVSSLRRAASKHPRCLVGPRLRSIPRSATSQGSRSGEPASVARPPRRRSGSCTDGLRRDAMSPSVAPRPCSGDGDMVARPRRRARPDEARGQDRLRVRPTAWILRPDERLIRGSSPAHVRLIAPPASSLDRRDRIERSGR